MADASGSKQRICPHCDSFLSKKALDSHRRLYYDTTSCTWIKKRCLEQPKPVCEFEEPSIDDFAFEISDDDNSGNPEIELPPPPIEFDHQETQDIAFADSCDEVYDQECSHAAADFDCESDYEYEVWNTDSENESSCDSSAPEEFVPDNEDTQSNDHKTLVQWLLIFILGFQAYYHLTDRAVESLYKFLHAFLGVIGKLCSTCAAIVKFFPATLNRAKSLLGCTVKFRKYVTCKQCFKIYSLVDCIEKVGSREVAMRCSYIPLGRHSRCDTPLLKTVELASKKKVFYPLLTYCYIDIRTALQALLYRENFYKMCQEWKTRNVPEGALSDIYDGKVWKEFEARNFFNDCSFAFMLNCDWFQPYKHLTYSVGAIYLTVLNLPPSLRNKIQNVCLVGILPGPHEPSHDINSFLEPVVKDLTEFWKGVELNVEGIRKNVRCALLNVSCDIPAGRKVCGFLGHSASLGCSKCYKYFPGSVGCKDYSGFDREKWKLRTGTQHRKDVEKISKCTSITARNKLESKLGCRYSALLQLPYFDPPVMLSVDPMHNLFLGIAKHHLKRIWMTMGLLDESKFERIQKRIDDIIVPPDIGRIPHKIKSGFSSFTAEQFKNWVNHFSIIVLRDILPDDHLECWRHFVLACRILCLKTITTNQIRVADALLLQYCKRVERMYGKDVTTPNMHYCCHIASCVFDFGPAHEFWLFSFERFNGMLGKIPNNNRSIEVQMMKRLQMDIQATSISHPSYFEDQFRCVLPTYELPAHITTEVSARAEATVMSNQWSIDTVKGLVLPSSFRVASLSSSSEYQLKELYSGLYDKPVTEIDVCKTVHKFSTVKLGAISLGSHKSRSHTSSVLFAQWNSQWFGFNSPTGISSDHELRPLKIDFFAKHAMSIENCTYNHCLASVKWFKQHPKKNVCGKPVTIWEHELFELENIIPIQLLCYRTVSVIDHLSDADGRVLFVSPLLEKLFL